MFSFPLLAAFCPRVTLFSVTVAFGLVPEDFKTSRKLFWWDRGEGGVGLAPSARWSDPSWSDAESWRHRSTCSLANSSLTNFPQIGHSVREGRCIPNPALGKYHREYFTILQFANGGSEHPAPSILIEPGQQLWMSLPPTSACSAEVGWPWERGLHFQDGDWTLQKLRVGSGPNSVADRLVTVHFLLIPGNMDIFPRFLHKLHAVFGSDLWVPGLCVDSSNELTVWNRLKIRIFVLVNSPFLGIVLPLLVFLRNICNWYENPSPELF